MGMIMEMGSSSSQFQYGAVPRDDHFACNFANDNRGLAHAELPTKYVKF